MRIVIIVLLLFILASLGSAIFYLVRDKGNSDRTVRALTVRIALSIVLFAIVILCFHFGIITK